MGSTQRCISVETAEQLIEAATAGDTGHLRQLIIKGEDVNYQDRSKYTALHFAAWKSHVECVRLLIDHGCDIHALGCYGYSVLHAAAIGGSIECVELLLDKGCDIHSRANDGGTLLHSAAQRGNIDCVQLLINKGCDIHARTEGGLTILHTAAKGGSTECIQFIHGLGVDISLICKEGLTAYDWAKQMGKCEAAGLLQRLSKIKPSNQQNDEHNKQENYESEPSTKSKEPITKSERFIQDSESSEITYVLSEQGTSYQLQQLNEDKNQPRNPSSNSTTNETEEQMREKQICCTGCKSKFNSLIHDTTLLKQKSAEMVDLGVYARENAVLKEHISSLETRMKSTEDLECQSRETQMNNDKLIHENRELKQNMTALELRVKTIEQRERGYSVLPHVAIPPEGFDIGNVVGKDYMQPQMTEIFSNKTFQAFKEYADPVLITDYLWAKHIITERQHQEIKAHTTDIGKAEYLWLLIKRGRYYLDAIRKASIDTNQGQIAALLKCTGRMAKREGTPSKVVNHHQNIENIPFLTWKMGSFKHVPKMEWTIFAGVSVSLLIAVLGILVCISVPTEKLV